MFKIKVLYHYLVTRYARRFRTREALLAWQKNKTIRFLGWALTHSVFYRKWFAGKSPEDWKSVALIDKSIMMENFDELNTVGIQKQEAFRVALHAESSRDFSPKLMGVTVGLSSGTSGNRGLFLVSDDERAKHAGTILGKILPGSILSKNRVAFFMRANSNLYTASQSSRLQFEFFDIFQPMASHLDRLKSFDPTLLFAPPSALLMLADFAETNRLDIKPLKIFSIAETLDPLDEKRIHKAFGQIIHQVYQCTEGFLGVTCEKGTLHLNEDCVQIDPDWIDDAKIKFYPIITDFSRKSQPVIRYRLNDILTVKQDPCPCGSIMMAIQSIEGRSDDLIYFGETPVFPDFIRRAIITSHPAIQEYMVQQNASGQITICLKVPDAYEKEANLRVQSELEALAAQQNAPLPGLTFTRQFPAPTAKKLRRVTRTI